MTTATRLLRAGVAYAERVRDHIVRGLWSAIDPWPEEVEFLQAAEAYRKDVQRAGPAVTNRRIDMGTKTKKPTKKVSATTTKKRPVTKRAKSAAPKVVGKKRGAKK